MPCDKGGLYGLIKRSLFRLSLNDLFDFAPVFSVSVLLGGRVFENKHIHKRLGSKFYMHSFSMSPISHEI